MFLAGNINVAQNPVYLKSLKRRRSYTRSKKDKLVRKTYVAKKKSISGVSVYKLPLPKSRKERGIKYILKKIVGLFSK